MQRSSQPNLNPHPAPLVTAVYWAILRDGTTFDSPLNCLYSFKSIQPLSEVLTLIVIAWNNISFHALNTGLAMVELAISCVPMPWGYLLLCVITLALYLGLAYLVHGVTQWYGMYRITLYLALI